MTEREFTQEVLFLPSYDHRDEGGGAHGAEMILVLKGPEGALSFTVYTGWMSNPLKEPFDWNQPTPRAREERAGMDATKTGENFFPIVAGVYSHRHTQKHEYEIANPNCLFLDGAPCYGDGSAMIGTRVFDALVSEGTDGVWRELREIYAEWF